MRLLIILFLITNLSYSQTDGIPFNKLDDKGEKHGYWKSYIDSNLNQVQDSNKAAWFYFRLYNHGKLVCGLEDVMIKDKDLDKFTFISRPPINNSMTALNDTIHLRLNRKDPNDYIMIFEHGFFKEDHRIYGQDGGNWDIINYRYKYKDNPYSFLYRIINSWSDKKINEGYYYFKNGKLEKEFHVINVESNKYDQNNTF